MNRKTTIALFYTGVALVSTVILGLAFVVNSRIQRQKPDAAQQTGPKVSNVGKERPEEWFNINFDLEAVNQVGDEVKLSDLRGKVFLIAQFFAVCPHCAVRNGEELHQLRETFGEHPDFHIVCISVDPESDDQERLQSYAEALGASPENWWFLNAGSMKDTHEYLENELKFFAVRERTDPVDIETNGRFAHDLGFLLVNRDFKVIGKWPLADAREQARSESPGPFDPDMYQRLKDDLYRTIREQLESPGSRP